MTDTTNPPNKLSGLPLAELRSELERVVKDFVDGGAPKGWTVKGVTFDEHDYESDSDVVYSEEVPQSRPERKTLTRVRMMSTGSTDGGQISFSATIRNDGQDVTVKGLAVGKDEYVY